MLVFDKYSLKCFKMPENTDGNFRPKLYSIQVDRNDQEIAKSSTCVVMLSLTTTRRSFWFIFELQDVERVICGLSTWAEIEHKNFKCRHVGLVKIDSEIILGQVGNLMET